MSKLAIIVDGQGDFAALKARFKDRFRILKTDGPRGHKAEIDRIVHGASKQLSILRALQYSEVIILLDFEARSMPYAKFVTKLESQMAEYCSVPKVRVVSPNMMIENWYLADVEFLSKKKKFLKDGLKQKTYEGRNGKAELKKLFIHGTTYNEVTHGAQLFELVRFAAAKKNSVSFDMFYKIIFPYL